MQSSTRTFLTLCIPTYQRAGYLRDLLASIELSYGNTPHRGEIGILIADNASEDETAKVVAEFQNRLPIQYQKNPVNIGGDRNFYHLIGQVRSEYFWLIGDDETLAVEALDHVLTLLKNERPDLLILRGTVCGKDWYDSDAPLPFIFSNYREFVAYYATRNIWPVLGHSLISLNVVKLSCHDLAKHEQVLQTFDIQYAHMYGLINGLKQSNGKVVLSAVPAVLIRDRRAPVGVDGLVITKLWRRYLAWVGEEFNHPQIVKYGRKLDGPSQRFKARRRKFSAWRRRLWANFKARFNSNGGSY